MRRHENGLVETFKQADPKELQEKIMNKRGPKGNAPDEN